MLQLNTEYRPDRGGLQRRDFLRLGALSSLGLTLGSHFGRGALAESSAVPASNAKAKACIVVWLSGGPSHLDTFDPKPEADEAYRGPFKAIDTNVSGIQVCEHLPHLAKQADKYCLLRSITHPSPSHDTARHIMLTGNVPARGTVNPSYGSVVFREYGQQAALPPYVAVPNGPNYAQAGFMGGAYNPLAVGNDPNRDGFRVQGLTLPKQLTVDRLAHRRNVLKKIDSLQAELDHPEQFDVLDKFYSRSYDMVTAPAVKKAFDIASEDSKLRERYGRNTLGQSCLLARRLVESGVSFVHVDRGGWDTHRKNFDVLEKTRLPELDQALAGLLEDLAQRGMLDSTIVLCMGEFGRTPKIDWSAQWQGGRHHYSKVFSALIAGGGFRGGHVVGSSTPTGELVESRPILPWDMGATMLGLLGIPFDKTYPDRGRNIRVLPYGTSVVSGGMLTEIM